MMKAIFARVGLTGFLLLIGAQAGWSEPVAERGQLIFHSVPDARVKFGGILSSRLERNIDQWLLPAPHANPGMLEMFRLRDREPAPHLVDWAGEFAGKYLISCVQALRLTARPELREQTTRFVSDLIATQAEDGYLGPFPARQRLLGAWDLWGHYHVMQGLLLWHDYAGDPAALAATCRGADLICRTFLDGSRRVIDAGSPEMNMAVAHVLAELYRRTGETRYLAMTREIVKDWERAGDYVRTGVAGIPFYQTPRPRWESLHDLQALTELWRITGEAQYRDAFLSHWQTILKFDRRNSGAFSGGEQATGNAFLPSAIETCCTVAWMALSIDMLKLTGDPRVADELELATFNAALGAQHPTGRWWAYNTPMDGERKASAHDIVFQARAGTPELNCCSVNGPRSLGMLSEWAVMRDDRGLVINWLGPLETEVADIGGREIKVRCETDYPFGGHLVWSVDAPGSVRLRIRIPAWAEGPTARIAGEPLAVTAGTYLEIERTWNADDRLELDLPMPLRTLQGEREQAGKVSIYRGPILLAFDQRDNPFDEKAIPSLDPSQFSKAKIACPAPDDDLLAPSIVVEIPTAHEPLRLRDFASAGASGTRYRSWLRMIGLSAPIGPDFLILSAALDAGAVPQFGQLVQTTTAGTTENGRAVRLNGRDEMLVYALPDDFGPDFTVAVRVRLREYPAQQLGQIFSAWAAAGDDPLRLTIEGGKLFARVEAGGSFSTGGVPFPLNEWHHIAAVKSGPTLTLYVDGAATSTIDVPAAVNTESRAAAFGGNPLFTGAPEFIAVDVADLLIRNRAATAKEIAAFGPKPGS